jgi:mRNA interferase RelE/StbE
MYAVVISKDAAKALQKMPRNIAELIREKIDCVAVDPYAANNNVKALRGRPGYRLRVGDWRVIYDLNDAVRVLSVQHVAPRGGAY